METLKGHTSAETAFVVDDYPYGFRLRCKIRYWLEFKKGKGFRFCSQTTNPKVAGERWNKPKASTYARYGGVILRKDNGHITWSGLSEYDDLGRCQGFLEHYGDTLPEEGRADLERFVRIKENYEAKKAQGIDYRDAATQACIEEAINSGEVLR